MWQSPSVGTSEDSDGATLANCTNVVPKVGNELGVGREGCTPSEGGAVQAIELLHDRTTRGVALGGLIRLLYASIQGRNTYHR
jgi:hypothetical protein